MRYDTHLPSKQVPPTPPVDTNKILVVLAIAGSVAVAAPSSISPVAAQSITPSHVYQVVDNVNGELALMHRANDSKARTDRTAPALSSRRPRHVIQKAREVFFKVQALRTVNGLSENSLPPLPVREVVPADVKNLVDRVLGDVRELRAKFGVTDASPNGPLPTGKTPTDVYGHLIKAGQQLDGLGIPRIVPNDVYRIAMTIVGDLEKVRAARGPGGAIAAETGASRKRPKHVYERGYQVLSRLKSLTERDTAFAVPGGVVLPNKSSGKVRPVHVLGLLNNILAEVGAIKVKLGVTSPTKLAPQAQGKTPSNVYDAVSTALKLVDSLGAPNS